MWLCNQPWLSVICHIRWQRRVIREHIPTIIVPVSPWRPEDTHHKEGRSCRGRHSKGNKYLQYVSTSQGWGRKYFLNVFPCRSFLSLLFVPISFSSHHLEQLCRNENHRKTALTLSLLSITVFSSSFPPWIVSTVGSQPLETQQTESVDPRIPPSVCYVRQLYCTAIVHHLAPAREEWASHTHFHCVYDKTYQLIAFWPDIKKKRPDKSHWKRVAVCVCAVCVTCVSCVCVGANTMKVSNSLWMKTALPALSTWIHACPGIICHG